MGTRKPIHATAKQIAAYWETRVCELDVGADCSEWLTHCWRCGCKRKTQRCHIVPQSLGGTDGPENLVLLCGLCHDEAPDCDDPSEIWRWIQDTKISMYGLFWSMRSLRDVVLAEGWEIWRRGFNTAAFGRAMDKVGLHWGQSGGSKLSVSSVSWAIRQSRYKKPTKALRCSSGEDAKRAMLGWFSAFDQRILENVPAATSPPKQ